MANQINNPSIGEADIQFRISGAKKEDLAELGERIKKESSGSIQRKLLDALEDKEREFN